ncbi:MAG: hypothetical protein AAF431_15190 [Pseudomonadota bacterium]
MISHTNHINSLRKPAQSVFQRSRIRGSLSLFMVLFLTSCAHPIFEAVETTTSAGSGSITLGIPASTRGTSAGDLLVATVGVRGNPATSFPSGWTAVDDHAGFNNAICSSDDDGIACQLSVYWKFASGSETSVNVGLTPANTPQAAGAVFRFSKTHTVNPIGQVATQNGNNNTPTAPNLVTNEKKVRVIQLVVSDTNGGSFPALPLTSEPANAVFNLNSATPLTRDSIVMGGAQFRKATAGSSTGAGVWTGGENNWRGSTITIRAKQPSTAVVTPASP